jgi:hypothetical protein
MENDKSKKTGEREIDIILGPTDNGVFVRALEYRIKLEKSGIPVISSEVSIKTPHQKGGWFFRTNINVERRVQLIYEFLTKNWIFSIAILYQKNEFGRSAEEAFRKELLGQQRERYLLLPYDSIDNARNQIRRILAQRPEAVGFFGNRADIVPLFRLLKNLNTGSTRYLPLIFSINDTRVIQRSLEPDYSVYFVSVTDITKDWDFDDVEALSYDTTAIILGELDALANSGTFNYKDPSWRQTFRNRFEAILNGSIGIGRNEGKIQLKTGISFKNYENKTTPRVFKLSRETISPVELGKTITFSEKIWNKVKLIWDRFGFWSIINLVIIFIVIVFMSIEDIKRWWWGKLNRLFLSLHFWFLLMVNIAIAYAIYFYLGETGNLRYDNVLMALILSLTPSALLHVTLFETSTGKCIGLERYYDDFLLWVYERIIIREYLRMQPFINEIAYHNTEKKMKETLISVYKKARSLERSIRMEKRMLDILNNAETEFERRKELAWLLLQRLGWRMLVERKLAPGSLVPDGKADFKNTRIDHRPFISEAVGYCGLDEKKDNLIEREIKKQLAKLPTERQRSLEAGHLKEIRNMKKKDKRLARKIAFLFMLKSSDVKFFIDNDLLPKDALNL